MVGEQYAVGDIVTIMDQVDLEHANNGTVKLIESEQVLCEGERIPLSWLYIIANDESLNIQFDPRIGNYWRVIADIDPLLGLLQRATVA